MSPSTFRSLILSILFTLSISLHPLLLKSILSTLSFTHSAALALLQLISISISLWFWTIFGLYKVRSPLFRCRQSLLLAILRAVRTLVAIHALERNSLAAFAAATLLVPALLHFTRGCWLHLAANALTVLGAFCTLVYEGEAASSGCSARIVLGIHVALGCLQQALDRCTQRVKGSELQIQLVVTSIATLVLIPAAVVEEVVFRPVSLLRFVYDEVAVVCILSTGLLAFWRFVVARAAVYRLSRGMALACVHLACLTMFVWAAREEGALGLGIAAAVLAVGGVLRVAAVESDAEEEGTPDAVV